MTSALTPDGGLINGVGALSRGKTFRQPGKHDSGCAANTSKQLGIRGKTWSHDSSDRHFNHMCIDGCPVVTILEIMLWYQFWFQGNSKVWFSSNVPAQNVPLWPSGKKTGPPLGTTSKFWGNSLSLHCKDRCFDPLPPSIFTAGFPFFYWKREIRL